MMNELPPGWTSQVDPTSGKTFYVHQATMKTQWAFPVAPPPQQTTASAPPVWTASAPRGYDAPPAYEPDKAPVVSQAPPSYDAPVANEAPPVLQQTVVPVREGWMKSPDGGCAIPGLEKLAAVKALYIKKDLWTVTAIRKVGYCNGACFDRPNLYKVFNEDGEIVYNGVKEPEDLLCCACVRCWCGRHYPLEVSFEDENEKRVAYLTRDCSFGGCCPAVCYLCTSSGSFFVGNNIKTTMGQPCGGGGFKPTYNLYSKRGELDAIVEGPAYCFGGLFESDFEIRSPTGERFGTISKEPSINLKDGAAKDLLVNSYNFKMEFDPETDVHMRAKMMGTLLLLDTTFFEREGTFNCLCEDTGCNISVRPCDLYLCGCVFPCGQYICCNKLDCCGDGEREYYNNELIFQIGEIQNFCSSSDSDL